MPVAISQHFDDSTLVAAIAQDWQNGEVLMMAWMNREALTATIATGRATYWSRSRNSLWIKGESSGHHQIVKEIAFDCDGDAILLKVDQEGAACHTGERSCFFSEIPLGSHQ
ncbi:MAG: phosphoribosyl-AMP cyclohydrolase [Actinomycetes bacterium]